MSEFADEKRIGDWVTARCRKRAEEHGKPMPQEVRDWLKTIKWNPGAKNTQAPGEVIDWLVSTIEDPDWPTG